MPCCTAPRCGNNSSTSKGIAFHSFPLSRPYMVERWLECLQSEGKKKDWRPNHWSKVCGRHFEERFILRLSQVRLTDDAIPTIFDPPSLAKVVRTFKARKEINQIDTTLMRNSETPHDTIEIAEPHLNNNSFKTKVHLSDKVPKLIALDSLEVLKARQDLLHRCSNIIESVALTNESNIQSNSHTQYARRMENNVVHNLTESAYSTYDHLSDDITKNIMSDSRIVDLSINSGRETNSPTEVLPSHNNNYTELQLNKVLQNKMVKNTQSSERTMSGSHISYSKQIQRFFEQRQTKLTPYSSTQSDPHPVIVTEKYYDPLYDLNTVHASSNNKSFGQESRAVYRMDELKFHKNTAFTIKQEPTVTFQYNSLPMAPISQPFSTVQHYRRGIIKRLETRALRGSKYTHSNVPISGDIRFTGGYAS